MKKSLNYLPANKRRDLRQLVEIIRDEVEDVVMVILYGSYARGTYVDYDQRIEYGVKTYFMSDYDLLVVTEKRMGNEEQTTYAKILRRFYTNRAWEISTRPQFINESIGELNKAIDKSRYFYTDIKREGVMLYDSGKYRLARRRKLNFGEISEMAKEYFEDKFPFANRFFENSKRDVRDNELRMSVFNLHQAAENYLRTIPMVFILYGYKEHDLASLMNQCKKHTLEIYRVFPQDTDEERRLFKLLQDAYVQARYNKNFVVTKYDIDTLIPKIERLRDIVDTVCRERIAYYDSLIKR
ncbi:MAG: HEPN domain-containing protein [Alistipes sp.]|nr:HEPN domain-containing protein [Alistipes sp.]